MADKAIGSLVEATVINDADRFVLEQSGQAKQISGATMISELAEALDGHGGIQSIDLVGGEGNVKTYRITFTDGTTYDYEVRDGESGNYAVVAGNLAPYSDASGATQSIPFLSQGTGRGNGSATVPAGNYCQLKKKLGNTVAVNQLVYNGTFAAKQSWSVFLADYSVSNNEATITQSGTSGGSIFQDVSIPAGHTVLLGASLKNGTATSISLYFRGGVAQTVTGSSYETIRVISTAGGNNRTQILVSGSSGTAYAKDVFLIDLTLWFGGNDRIPSDLLSHPENWGRYYAGALAYNAGTLESADGTVLRSIWRNVWDEEWIESASRVQSKNFIPVSPNTAYYRKSPNNIMPSYYDENEEFIAYGTWGVGSFTTPSNCHLLKFMVDPAYGTIYKNDITISLYYSGESGYSDYYPFSVLAEVDTGSEVLRSAGSAADEKTPDGTITRRIKSVDLSSLTWSLRLTGTTHKLWSATLPSVYKAKYSTDAKNNWRSAPFFYIHNTSYTTVATAGVDYCDVGVYDYVTSGTSNVVYCITGVSDSPTGYLFYELATPATEQGTAFAENIPCDPVGSMSWENTNGIPQDAEIFYPFDYAGTLDSMLKALPSANGTYTFKATVANGKITYSWVAD